MKRSDTQELLLWLLRLRRRYHVNGASMSPLLQPGDEVLVDPRAYRSGRPNPGDIVVAQHPYKLDTKVIKRVHSVADDGTCYLVGDNPRESSDSRSLGSFPIDQILGRVTSKFG